MKKTLFLIVLLFSIQTGFAQIIPTLPTKPKAVSPEPKSVLKKKIVYRDRPEETRKTITQPIMVFVQGSTFSMGSDASDGNSYIHVHSVTVSNFRISKYEVTVAQYREYCNSNGTNMPEAPKSGWKDNYPIVNVSYDDANRYCNWLSEKTGKDYRLPTEAEWEFAARGGNNSNNYTYSGGNDIEEVAWYYGNSNYQSHLVGQKRPNELGLYDMTGNVWEWCKDWYAEDYYWESPESNPKGPLSGTNRISRGGCMVTNSRVSDRNYYAPDFHSTALGFRVVSN